MSLPSRAHVVIIGGGAVGTSVAYHLTALGWTDVVLLEQGKLSSGTTWHAAGLVGLLRASESGTRLVQYSAELYQRLEAETGLATGYKACGGLIVARTKDRMVQLKRTAATAAAFDLECELLTPAQAGEIYPILRTDDLQGAIWLPGDGTVNPTDLTQSLAKGARQRGARVFERTRVTGIEPGYTVVTDQGTIEAEVVVNCAGQWAKAVGAMAGVNVPLHSAEHFYVVTERIEGVRPDYPILRDPDGYTYVKEEVGGLVVGGFEPEAKPWVSPDSLPYPFEFQLLEEDWEHFEVLMNSALHRLPVLNETGIKKFYNGPESFTPDNQFILGEGARNFFVGAGFNSVGIASAGGAGRALAEWIVAGEPTMDLGGVDIRRFGPFNGNNQWLRARVAEVLGLHYEIPWPNRELATARPFRRSPVHHLHEGAFWGSKLGWERVNVFCPEPVVYSWGRQNWQPYADAEHRACREDVALFDQTSFGKLLVKGADAERGLQWVCTNDVAVQPGRTVYTGVLNERGGYEADVTVTRLAADEYLWVTSAGSVYRDLDHLRRHLPGSVAVVDVTAMYAVFGVMGPRSRELLQKLTRVDLSHAAFPFGTSQEIDLGPYTVRATRITYVGELGWELYVPVEFAVGVYELLLEDNPTRAGYYAINSLRLEKGYRAFGADIGPDDNPVEAGLTFTCKDGPYLGREAVEKATRRRRLVSFVVDDPEVMLWGGELVLRDGEPAGRITSAAWAATTGSCVALGYVDGTEGRFEVNAGGDVRQARLHLRPPYDPGNEKIRR
ncbi:GcvT family protein [Nonomuraea soli]|uniref:4-methylaminobutanoate oxidase (Formaldehyde-forming) n=1 Tax=Nonomuraea soli TaxID=1032476 RepID=A0A7W0CPS8_9ACTN|nr:FAD-dependent oxidoreductase [Nonomuraea soli]MBA2895035.1 4-methylaminobutanoate oxidase (formaldehyde-forming) [Nonomuraea soli]